MDNTTLAYVAGFIDGEGSIYVSRGRQLKDGNWQYFLCVSMNNTHHSVLYDFQRDFGGAVSLSPDRRDGRRQLARLRIYSQEAAFLLSQIAPYLRIKQQQAQLALDFQSGISTNALTEAQKLWYKAEISKFNQKGVRP